MLARLDAMGEHRAKLAARPGAAAEIAEPLVRFRLLGRVSRTQPADGDWNDRGRESCLQPGIGV